MTSDAEASIRIPTMAGKVKITALLLVRVFNVRIVVRKLYPTKGILVLPRVTMAILLLDLQQKEMPSNQSHHFCAAFLHCE